MCYWFPVQVNLVMSRQFRFRIWYHEWVLWFLWMLMMIDCWFLSALSYLSSFGLQRWSSSTVYEKGWVSQICWFQAWHLGLSPANLFRFAVLLSQRCRLFLDFGFETDHFDHFHFSVIFASNISDWNTQGVKEFSILVLHIWQGMVLARRSTGFGKCQSWRVDTERIWELNAFCFSFKEYICRCDFWKWHEYVSSIHININIQLHRRKCQGVIDTALRTANSGYLYRRMDFTASPVVVSWLHLSNRIGISEAVFNPTSISNDKHIRGFCWGDLSRLWHWRGCADAFQEAKTGRSRFRRSHPRPCASGGCATSERFFFALQEGVTQLKWQKHFRSCKLGFFFLPMTVWLCDCMTASVLLRSWNSKASSNSSRSPGNWKEMEGMRCWWNWGWYIHCDRNIFWCQKCNGSVKSCRSTQ